MVITYFDKFILKGIEIIQCPLYLYSIVYYIIYNETLTIMKELIEQLKIFYNKCDETQKSIFIEKLLTIIPELNDDINDYFENEYLNECNDLLNEISDDNEKDLLEHIKSICNELRGAHICHTAADAVEEFDIDDLIDEIPYYEREYYLNKYLDGINNDDILSAIGTNEFDANDGDQQNITLNKCAMSISRWYTIDELKNNICEYIDNNFYKIKNS